MEKYEVIVPLEGFKLTVRTDAWDTKDAIRAAVDLIMYQFPLVINSSEEFEFRGCLVGRPQSVRKLAE